MRRRRTSAPDVPITSLAWYVTSEDVYTDIDVAWDSFARATLKLQDQIGSGDLPHLSDMYNSNYVFARVALSDAQEKYDAWNARWKPECVGGDRPGRFLLHSTAFLRSLTGARSAMLGAVASAYAATCWGEVDFAELAQAVWGDAASYVTQGNDLYELAHDPEEPVNDQEAIQLSLAAAESNAQLVTASIDLVARLDAASDVVCPLTFR